MNPIKLFAIIGFPFINSLIGYFLQHGNNVQSPAAYSTIGYVIGLIAGFIIFTIED